MEKKYKNFQELKNDWDYLSPFELYELSRYDSVSNHAPEQEENLPIEEANLETKNPNQ